MYRIFLVEDDEIISNEVKKYLEGWDFEVYAVNDFKNVINEFINISPQLVILDISLPFFNGYHWCREIRNISKVPIIFLSSASDNLNMIMAMDMGADDYVTKPFNSEFLLSKIRAILRRSYDFKESVNVIEHNGLMLRMNDMVAIHDLKELELSKNEYKILETLMKEKNNIVSREHLMMKLWQNDEFVDDNTLSVNVARLRRGLESIGLSDFIKTKVGVGYYV